MGNSPNQKMEPFWLGEMLPRDKMETERAAALVALGYPAVAPVIPQMLWWLQDSKWPVFREFAPFLATLGDVIAKDVRPILEAADDTWKKWVLLSVVKESPALARALAHELRRIEFSPTAGEYQEGLDAVARHILGE